MLRHRLWSQFDLRQTLGIFSPFNILFNTFALLSVDVIENYFAQSLKTKRGFHGESWVLHQSPNPTQAETRCNTNFILKRLVSYATLDWVEKDLNPLQ